MISLAFHGKNGRQAFPSFGQNLENGHFRAEEDCRRILDMSSEQMKLVARLQHQINSPLAAIRNALYLAAGHPVDAKVAHYLKLADLQVSRIAGILRSSAVDDVSSGPV